MTSKLTLNLGVRYDLTIDSFAQYGEFEPFMEKGRPQDADNIQPRLGFAYQLNDRTVHARRRGQVLRRSDHAGRALRAGAGDDRRARGGQRRPAGLRAQPVQRPGAVRSSRRETRFCSAPSRRRTSRPGAPATSRARRRACCGASGEMAPPAEYAHVPHTWQTHDRRAAADRQLDVGGGGLRLQPRPRREVHPGERQPQLRPMPAASASTTRTRNRALLPYPEFGIVAMTPFTGTLRLSRAADRVHQAHEQPLAGAARPIRWPGCGARKGSRCMGVPGIGAAAGAVHGRRRSRRTDGWTFAQSDQRHRAVFNGIWQVGRGFQVSGVHYFGAGNRSSGNYGGDRRNLGAGGELRLRPDGTIVPRNAFIQPPQNRTDVRIQQRIPLRAPRVDRPDCRGVQRVQPPELDAGDAGKQRGLQQARGGAVPHGAVRIQAGVLVVAARRKRLKRLLQVHA